MNLQNYAVLKRLREGMIPGQKSNKNLISLSKALGMEERDLDRALKELERERFINEWSIESSKDFRVEILLKGFADIN